MGWIASDVNPRCRDCNKLLAEKVTRPWRIVCGRCKSVNEYSNPSSTHELVMDEDKP